MKSPVR